MSTIVQELSKECRKCGEIKVLEGFHTEKSSPDGRRAVCKTCRNADIKKSRLLKNPVIIINPDLIKAKPCTVCEKIKPLDAFNVGSKYKLGRRGQCRECEAVSKRAYSRTNSKAINAYGKKWAKNNRDKRNAGNRKRRASKVDAENDNHTDQQVWELYGTDCYLCGAQVVEDGKRLPDYHEEHVMAVKHGGHFTLDNVRPSCRSCNLSKATKPLLKFLAQRQPDDLLVTEADSSEYAEECRRLDSGMICVGYAVRT